MFSRRKGRCCITATRRSSNAPLNPPVVSFAASSNNSPVSPATYPRIPPREHLIWDNLSAHKKALRLWEPKPERVRFAWIPTNASWLNLIEAWFSVLERTALHNTYLRTPTEIEASLQRGIAYLNEHPKPYRWTKTN